MSWAVTLFLSLLCHLLLAILLSLNPWPSLTQVRPSAYTVMLMPVSLAEPLPTPSPPPPHPKESEVTPPERTRPFEKPKKEEIVEKVKKKEENREALERLEKAMEEIRRQAALDAIQKRIEKRETPPSPVQTPPIPSTPAGPSSTGPSPPSPLSAAMRQSKLNEYYSWIWAKIKSSWTLPEPLLKDGIDLETIIVIIIEKDGKVRRSWFEKRSGNALYDQMAMRAIIKADPLPPIPKELDLEMLEIGIRFIPD